MTKKSSAPKVRYSLFVKEKKVTSAQYITELICERKAKIESGGDLPPKFWQLPKWKKYFQFQIVIANRLLKKYRDDAIISALEDNRSYKTYSLRSPVLESIIKEYEKKGPPPPKPEVKLEPPKTEKLSGNSAGSFSKSKTKLEDL